MSDLTCDRCHGPMVDFRARDGQRVCICCVSDEVHAARSLSARLAEALGENYGRPKACGHDFDCLCVGDKSLRVLADYAAATKERT